MYPLFSEDGSADAVIERLDKCRDPRFHQVMSCAIRHLHAFVKEVEPSMEEWAEAIAFLTATGQMCDDKRQEWILASDTLGVSMLVETINNRSSKGQTEATVLGPFHVSGADLLDHGDNICKEDDGEPCFVEGYVKDTDGNPVAGAILDIWQTNAHGFYDVQQPGDQPIMNMRGQFKTDENGYYAYRTVKPVSYPIPTDGPVGKMLEHMGRHPYRPAHIHYIAKADGFDTITTHIFLEGDPYLHSDAVFGVKDSLVVPFTEKDNGEWYARFDLVLAKE